MTRCSQGWSCCYVSDSQHIKCSVKRNVSRIWEKSSTASLLVLTQILFQFTKAETSSSWNNFSAYIYRENRVNENMSKKVLQMINEFLFLSTTRDYHKLHLQTCTFIIMIQVFFTPVSYLDIPYLLSAVNHPDKCICKTLQYLCSFLLGKHCCLEGIHRHLK